MPALNSVVATKTRERRGRRENLKVTTKNAKKAVGGSISSSMLGTEVACSARDPNPPDQLLALGLCPGAAVGERGSLAAISPDEAAFMLATCPTL